MADAAVADAAAERIRDAAAARAPLRIRGGGTKDFYGERVAGDVARHARVRGIVAYEPTELVLTARAGTPLAEIEARARRRRPDARRSSRRTSAPARRWAAASPPASRARAARTRARCATSCSASRIVNGKGEDLSFGGRVIKNVAGYDVVAPDDRRAGHAGRDDRDFVQGSAAAARRATLALRMPQTRRSARVNGWAGQPLPLSATAWQDGRLRVRLSGAGAGGRGRAGALGGEEAGDAERFWRDVRDHTPDRSSRRPARAAVAAVGALDRAVRATWGDQLIEWGGALRWSGAPAALGDESSAPCARAPGGHATLFRGGDKRSACSIRCSRR